jgi:hypothetical protein
MTSPGRRGMNGCSVPAWHAGIVDRRRARR